MRRATWLLLLPCAGLILACAGPAGPSRDPAALADAYAEQGRWNEASREIELAVRMNPREPDLRRRAAAIHRKAENYERAIGHLEVAIQLTPRDAELWINLGDLEKSRENISDAYVAYRRAAELAPQDLRAVSGLALSADQLGFDAEAEAAYARWAELEREQGVDEVPASPP